MPLSGPQWVSQFPSSSRPDDLAEPFRSQVNRFLAALRTAGAKVTISATLRPPQRAYLMHFSFCVAKEALDPAAIPAMAGVDIQWVHTDASGNPDLAASRSAAQQMVQGYGIVFKPVLTSRHTEGNAIDMDISWQGNLTITNAGGNTSTVTTTPRTGSGNIVLQGVGSGYSVRKLPTDPPHWSTDGH